MNSIVLSQDEVVRIFQWRDAHTDLVRSNPNPMSGLKIVCKDTGITINGTRKSDVLLLQIYVNKKHVGDIKFKFLLRDSGQKFTYAKIIRDTTKMFVTDDKRSMLSLWCSLMAMMVYGEVEQSKVTDKQDDAETSTEPTPKPKKHGKKTPRKTPYNHITYILKSHTSKQNGSGEKRHYTKSSMQFSVRGHYRHYKSGKVVWISEYQKGSGEQISRTYKLGGKQNSEEEK